MKKIVNISFFSRSRLGQDPTAGSFYGWHSKFGRVLSRCADLKNFQIECWSPDIAIKNEILYEKEGITYRIFPGTFCLRPGREISLRLMRALRRECREHEVIIQLHDFHNWQAYLICAIFKTYPIVVQDHGVIKTLPEKMRAFWLLPFLPLWIVEYWLERKFSKNVFCFLAPNSERERYFNLLGARRTEFCPMAVDVTAFFPVDKRMARKQVDVPENHKILLHVGGFAPHKNLELLVSVFSEVAKSQPVFLIMAGPDYDLMYKDKIIALFQKNGLLERVKILGNISKERLNILYNAADVLLVTSREEGGPTVTLEALATGTPVISTNMGFARDFEERARGLLLISAPPEFASTVLGFLSKPWKKKPSQLVWSWDDARNLYVPIYVSALEQYRHVPVLVVEQAIRIIGPTTWYSELHRKRLIHIIALTSQVLNGRNCRVLEVGCWPGYGAVALSLLGHAVDAVDVEPERIAVAAPYIKSLIGFDFNSCLRIPLDSSIYDCISCSEVIEHLNPTAAKKMLLELRRVLKPGGAIILTTPNRYGLGRLLRFWKKFTYCADSHGHGHWREYSLSEIKAICRAVGLSALRARRINFYSEIGKRKENSFFPIQYFWREENMLHNFLKLVSLPLRLIPYSKDSIEIIAVKIGSD